jgi:hypothetical protein
LGAVVDPVAAVAVAMVAITVVAVAGWHQVTDVGQVPFGDVPNADEDAHDADGSIPQGRIGEEEGMLLLVLLSIHHRFFEVGHPHVFRPSDHVTVR